MHRSRECRNPTYDSDESRSGRSGQTSMGSPREGGPQSNQAPHMETARRENYDSGEDFVLEYGELRFTFNEADFSERCEQAALKLGFVGGRLGDEELEDLGHLAVNGEILDPASGLG